MGLDLDDFKEQLGDVETELERVRVLEEEVRVIQDIRERMVALATTFREEATNQSSWQDAGAGGRKSWQEAWRPALEILTSGGNIRVNWWMLNVLVIIMGV